jgi:alkylation response protein AidB-like acyl-CoA dehydrogenase
VPVDNLVGEENRGWDCAKYLLTYERTNSANVGASYAALGRLKALAATRTRNGRPLAEDPLFAARLARVEIELDNMSTTNLRVIASVAEGAAPGTESSILKILGTEIPQEISNLARMAMGPEARALRDESSTDRKLTRDDRAALNYFNLRKLTIFAGSNEIQKNIIAKMMLGL